MSAWDAVDPFNQLWNGFVNQQLPEYAQHVVVWHSAKGLLNVKPNSSQFALVLALDNFIEQNQFFGSNSVISEGSLVLCDETFFQHYRFNFEQHNFTQKLETVAHDCVEPVVACSRFRHFRDQQSSQLQHRIWKVFWIPEHCCELLR